MPRRVVRRRKIVRAKSMKRTAAPAGWWTRKPVTGSNPKFYKPKPVYGSAPYKRAVPVKRGGPGSGRRPAPVGAPPYAGPASYVNRPVISTHNDMTQHWIGAFQIGPSKWKKTIADYQYQNINQKVFNIVGAGLVSAVQGRQLVDFCEVIMPTQWLNGSAGSTTRSDRTSIPDSLFEFNPYNQEPLTAFYTGALAQSDFDSLYVKSVDCSLSILSMTTVPQHVQIYFVTPVNDTANDPAATWNNVMADLGDRQGAPTIASALASLAVNAGSVAADNWGANPYSNKHFGKAYRCIKSVEVIMQPGDQRFLKYRMVYNRTFSKALFKDERQRPYLAGITIFPMFVIKAGLVGISTALGTDSTECAFGRVKLGCVHNMVVKMGALPPARIDHSRIYKGVIEAATDVQKEIDDNDNVQIPETN